MTESRTSDYVVIYGVSKCIAFCFAAIFQWATTSSIIFRLLIPMTTMLMMLITAKKTTKSANFFIISCGAVQSESLSILALLIFQYDMYELYNTSKFVITRSPFVARFISYFLLFSPFFPPIYLLIPFHSFAPINVSIIIIISSFSYSKKSLHFSEEIHWNLIHFSCMWTPLDDMPVV